MRLNLYRKDNIFFNTIQIRHRIFLFFNNSFLLLQAYILNTWTIIS